MKVTIYSTATCSFCKMLKKFFDDHQVKYEEKKADEDQALARELYEVSGQLGVPFTIIDKEDGSDPAKVLGFDLNKLHAIFGQ